MTFNNYIGHKNIIRNIAKAIKENRFSHAHLIVGEDGIGKSFLAKAVALDIMGLETDRDHIDILKWRVEKNKKSIGVNEIRDLIKEVNKKPFEGDKKVIIVHDGEKMTPQAQNAFLKTIEEPPAGVFILVLTENISSILDTIQSRCQIHKLNKLKNSEMEEILEKEGCTSEEVMKMAIWFSEGIPGRAEKFLYDEVYREIREFSLKLINVKKCNDTFEHIPKITEFKDRWDDLYGCVVNLIRDMVIIKECNDTDMVINRDYISEIEVISEDFSYKSLLKILKSINKTNEKIKKNLNFNIAIEVMLLELQEV